tara:strand:+ start:256 stop:633 length:378 start_codon:yes stop_codon:yes gene_type:complete
MMNFERNDFFSSLLFDFLDFFAQNSTLSLFERDTKKPKVFLLCNSVLSQNDDDAQRAHHDHSSAFCSSRPLEKTILLHKNSSSSFFLCVFFSSFFFFFLLPEKKKENLQKRNPKLSLTKVKFSSL